MMSLFKYLTSSVVVLSAVLACAQAGAHGRWVVPSHTILSGDNPEHISLDFSISNQYFHPDLAYGGDPVAVVSKSEKTDKTPSAEDRLEALRSAGMQKQFASTRVVATLPDGSVDKSLKIVNLGRKSAAAMLLKHSGTYRFDIAQAPVMVVLFKKPDGTPWREFGTLEQVKPLLPEGASEIKTLRVTNTVNTFVTRNQSTQKAIKPRQNGLEVKFYSHPNDLFAGEKTKAQLLLNGKPAAHANLKLTRSGTRWRNQRNTTELTSDSKGEFEISWHEAGMYLLEAEVHAQPQSPGIDMEMFALYTTLEVNPQ